MGDIDITDSGQLPPVRKPLFQKTGRGAGLKPPRRPATKTSTTTNVATNPTTNPRTASSTNRADGQPRRDSRSSRKNASTAPMERPRTKAHTYWIERADKERIQSGAWKSDTTPDTRTYFLRAIESVIDETITAITNVPTARGTFVIGTKPHVDGAWFGIKLLATDGRRIADLAAQAGVGPSEFVRTALHLYHQSH